MDTKYIITTAIAVLAILIPILVNLKRRKVLLFVDDDIEYNPMFYKVLENHFNKFKFIYSLKPELAIRKLKFIPKKKVLVVSDLIFRNSRYNGDYLAQYCFDKKIKILLITGHKKETISKEVSELKKFGVDEDMIISKPISEKEHNDFIKKIEKIVKNKK